MQFTVGRKKSLRCPSLGDMTQIVMGVSDKKKHNNNLPTVK
jgi:hypothetical protein